MAGRRLEGEEPPLIRPVLGFGPWVKRHGLAVGGKLEPARLEVHTGPYPYPASLEVALLERPDGREQCRARLWRGRAEGRDLLASEAVLGESGHATPRIDAFDVGPDVRGLRHSHGDEPLGVRQAHAQRRGARGGEELGPGVPAVDKAPRTWIARRVEGQDRAAGGVGDQSLAS